MKQRVHLGYNNSMLDNTILRRDFPILSTTDKPIIYFDNACMSLRPRAVIEAITSYYETLSACAGRSNHRLADGVAKLVDEARETVRQFIGAANVHEIIFTRNTTEGINLLAQSLTLTAHDIVVISDKEHNSNLVPWLRLQETKGIELRVVPSTETNEADLSAWEAAVVGAKIVSLVHTSNLDGVTNPVERITKLAHAHGALVIVDAAQSVPHQKINVKQLDVDFMVFSVHKMCGPSGMGILYGKLPLLENISPFLVGGDTVSHTSYDSYTLLPVPEKFEAGLQDYAGIAGTKAAIDYITQVGLDAISIQEHSLNTLLSQELARFDRVHLIGPREPAKRAGIVSFTVDGADHHLIAKMLDQVGAVAVRSGQHCVHSWFTSRKISGSVRASLYFYNTPNEVASFINTLDQVLSIV